YLCPVGSISSHIRSFFATTESRFSRDDRLARSCSGGDFRAQLSRRVRRRIKYGGKPIMPIRLVVAVTDRNWFDYLRQQQPRLNEINFWSPSPRSFQALRPGELFLFKLHAPINMIVGGGVFAFANVMPLQLAWEAFGEANGVQSLGEMRNRIAHYRRAETGKPGPVEIGCRILTQPFFLPESEWIVPPASW